LAGVKTRTELPDRIVRRRELLQLVGLGITRINQLERAGLFPRRVSLGGARAVGWRFRQVAEWIASRPTVASLRPAIPVRRGRPAQLPAQPTPRRSLPAIAPELPNIVLDHADEDEQ
jgi:prophage regulatory protein